MNANHTSILLHLLDNDFRIQLRPHLFIANRNDVLQLLFDPTRFDDNAATSSITHSLYDIFPFNDELSVIDGNFTGRRFHFVSLSHDFARIQFQNGEIRRIKKQFAGIQLIQLRRSPRIAVKSPIALQSISSNLNVCDEVDMNEVRHWIKNRYRQVQSPKTVVTPVHTFRKLPRSETDQSFWSEEDEDRTAWEDSQHPCKVELDEEQDSQAMTQPESVQPSRRVHWPKTVETSVHTFPMLRRSEVRRLFWSDNLHQRVQWPENVVTSVHTFPILRRSEVRRLFWSENQGRVHWPENVVTSVHTFPILRRSKERMDRHTRQHPFDPELDEDSEAQTQSESGCCVS